jgi:PilZ domain
MAENSHRQEDSNWTRRRFQRFRFDVPVRVILRQDSRKQAFPGRGTGMNEGGIAVALDVPLAIGSWVELEFTPPYAALALRVRGAVRNIHGGTYGIEFLTADAGEQEEVGLFRQMLRAAAERLGDEAAAVHP